MSIITNICKLYMYSNFVILTLSSGVKPSLDTMKCHHLHTVQYNGVPVKWTNNLLTTPRESTLYALTEIYATDDRKERWAATVGALMLVWFFQTLAVLRSIMFARQLTPHSRVFMLSQRWERFPLSYGNNIWLWQCRLIKKNVQSKWNIKAFFVVLVHISAMWRNASELFGNYWSFLKQ